jgi:hypothetical protein
MNKTWPISNFKSGTDSEAIDFFLTRFSKSDEEAGIARASAFAEYFH